MKVSHIKCCTSVKKTSLHFENSYIKNWFVWRKIKFGNIKNIRLTILSCYNTIDNHELWEAYTAGPIKPHDFKHVPHTPFTVWCCKGISPRVHNLTVYISTIVQRMKRFSNWKGSELNYLEEITMLRSPFKISSLFSTNSMVLHAPAFVTSLDTLIFSLSCKTATHRAPKFHLRHHAVTRTFGSFIRNICSTRCSLALYVNFYSSQIIYCLVWSLREHCEYASLFPIQKGSSHWPHDIR